MYPPAMCNNCKNFFKSKEEPSCKAFPEGIPEYIFYENGNHKFHIAGDNGIKYDSIDKNLDFWSHFPTEKPKPDENQSKLGETIPIPDA